MKITLAKTAGFCFGVNRSINLLEELVKNNEKNVYTFGPIIHNETVVEKYHKKGITVCEDIDKITPQDTVVIRSHGVSKSVFEAIKSKTVKVIDATCPFVKKIHKMVENACAEGKRVFVIGTKKSS